jgi:hypothetical protein
MPVSFPLSLHIPFTVMSPLEMAPLSPSLLSGMPLFRLFPNHPLYLHDVLVTPRIIKNLISVCQFTTDNNYSVDFDPFGFSVKDLLTRRELLRCNSMRSFTLSSAWRPVLSLPPPPLMIHGTVASVILVMTLIVVFPIIFLCLVIKTQILALFVMLVNLDAMYVCLFHLRRLELLALLS